MQLKVKEYEILSDLFYAINENPIYRKRGLYNHKSFNDLYEKAGFILDNVRERHFKQNKKTSEYIASKRKTNKNYAR